MGKDATIKRARRLLRRGVAEGAVGAPAFADARVQTVRPRRRGRVLDLGRFQTLLERMATISGPVTIAHGGLGDIKAIERALKDVRRKRAEQG